MQLCQLAVHFLESTMLESKCRRLGALTLILKTVLWFEASQRAFSDHFLFHLRHEGQVSEIERLLVNLAHEHCVCASFHELTYFGVRIIVFKTSKTIHVIFLVELQKLHVLKPSVLVLQENWPLLVLRNGKVLHRERVRHYVVERVADFIFCVLCSDQTDIEAKILLLIHDAILRHMIALLNSTIQIRLGPKKCQ